MIDRKKVMEALSIVKKALEDEDFLKWVEEHIDELNYDYDQYVYNCYDSFEEPRDFYIWALNLYLNEEDP